MQLLDMNHSHLPIVNTVLDPKNVRSFLNINWFEWRPDDDPVGSKHVAILNVNKKNKLCLTDPVLF